MENPKKAEVQRIQLYNVRFNGKQYTGSNGLYCGADVDLASISKLQSFFLTTLHHQSRLSSFMPVNPEHGLHCTIVYSTGTSPLPAAKVREYAATLTTKETVPFRATVTGFEYWPDKKKPGGYLVAKLNCPPAAELSKRIQKDLQVEHSFKDDYQAHVTLTDGRDGQAYEFLIPLLNERLKAFSAKDGIEIEFNFVGIRDII